MTHSYLTFLLLLCFSLPQLAVAGPWNLPSTLNEANTEISFEVDSNFHLIRGRSNKLLGSAWLSDGKNPFSVTSDVVVPVSALLTQDESDVPTFHAMMEKERFPEVRVKINGTGQHCTPEEVQHAPCATTLQTQVTIRDISKQMNIPVTLQRHQQSYVITGTHSFEWASFGIEDQSPFLVVLDPEVNVSFRIELPPLPLG